MRMPEWSLLQGQKKFSAEMACAVCKMVLGWVQYVIAPDIGNISAMRLSKQIGVSWITAFRKKYHQINFANGLGLTQSIAPNTGVAKCAQHWDLQ